MQLWQDLQEYQRFEDTLIEVRMWSRRETKASHSQPILDTHLSARNLSASESSLDGVSDLVNNDWSQKTSKVREGGVEDDTAWSIFDQDVSIIL